jgi:hypothetical protein
MYCIWTKNTKQQKQTYDDVIIIGFIGGGIAGSCTAIRLAQMFNSAAATWRIIDERTTEKTFKVGESLPQRILQNTIQRIKREHDNYRSRIYTINNKLLHVRIIFIKFTIFFSNVY